MNGVRSQRSGPPAVEPSLTNAALRFGVGDAALFAGWHRALVR